MFSRKLARIIVPVFLAVVLVFLTNTTVNQHFHRLSSGYVVSHAHPFDKSNTGKPFQDHHHSSTELIILEQISHTVFWIYLFFIILTPLLITFVLTNFPLLIFFKNPDHRFIKNYRAPPEIIISL